MNLVATKPVQSSTGTIEAGRAFRVDPDRGEELVRTGYAVPEVAGWHGLRWPGAEVAIIASGPSLTVEQCEAVQVWRKTAGDAGAQQNGRRCIAINTTFRRALFADVLYACDEPWWRLHVDEARETFAGQLWSQDDRAMRQFAVHHIRSERAPGLGRRPGLIHQGGNSGYQAMNLAYQAGAKRLILLGFDMHGTHWHGKYENGLTNTPKHLFQVWIDNFAVLARDLTAEGVDVLNCSPGSALKCFQAMDLAEALR